MRFAQDDASNAADGSCSCRVPQIVHRLLDICGLTRLVDIRDDFNDIEADRIARGGGLRRIELIAGSEER